MWGVLLWRSLKNGNSDTEWGKETVFPKPVTRVHWSITLQALVHLLLQDYKSVHTAIIHRWENHGTGQVGLNWDHTSAEAGSVRFQTAVYREERGGGPQEPRQDSTSGTSRAEATLLVTETHNWILRTYLRDFISSNSFVSFSFFSCASCNRRFRSPISSWASDLISFAITTAVWRSAWNCRHSADSSYIKRLIFISKGE